jgi:hypothetical protein
MWFYEAPFFLCRFIFTLSCHFSTLEEAEKKKKMLAIFHKTLRDVMGFSYVLFTTLKGLKKFDLKIFKALKDFLRWI